MKEGTALLLVNALRKLALGSVSVSVSPSVRVLSISIRAYHAGRTLIIHASARDMSPNWWSGASGSTPHLTVSRSVP